MEFFLRNTHHNIDKYINNYIFNDEYTKNIIDYLKVRLIT